MSSRGLIVDPGTLNRPQVKPLMSGTGDDEKKSGAQQGSPDSWGLRALVKLLTLTMEGEWAILQAEKYSAV